MKIYLIVLASLAPLIAQEASEDLDSSYQSLKEAVEKKDPASVKKLSALTFDFAKRIISAPDADKGRVEHAKEVEKYAEYSLSATALVATDPKATVDLTEILEQRNPKSEYLGQVIAKYTAVETQAGHPEKGAALAERVIKVQPSNAEALLIAAEYNLQKQRTAQAGTYAARAVDILSKKKGEPGNDALLGHANYIAGVAYGAQTKWPQANSALQAALPTLKGNPAAMGYALFYLGLANYQLGKLTLNRAQMRLALNYFEQCAAISGPMQGQASQNVAAIRAELR